MSLFRYNVFSLNGNAMHVCRYGGGSDVDISVFTFANVTFSLVLANKMAQIVDNLNISASYLHIFSCKLFG